MMPGKGVGGGDSSEDFDAFVNADLSSGEEEEKEISRRGAQRERPRQRQQQQQQQGGLDPYDFELEGSDEGPSSAPVSVSSRGLGPLARQSQERAREQRIAEILARTQGSSSAGPLAASSTLASTQSADLGGTHRSVGSDFADFAFSLKQLQAERDALKESIEQLDSRGIEKKAQGVSSPRGETPKSKEESQHDLDHSIEQSDGAIGNISSGGDGGGGLEKEFSGSGGSTSATPSLMEAISLVESMDAKREATIVAPSPPRSLPLPAQETLLSDVQNKRSALELQGGWKAKPQEEEKETHLKDSSLQRASVASGITASVESVPPAPPRSDSPPHLEDLIQVKGGGGGIVTPRDSFQRSADGTVSSPVPPPPPPTTSVLREPRPDGGTVAVAVSHGGGSSSRSVWEVPVSVPSFDDLQNQLRRLKELPLSPRAGGAASESSATSSLPGEASFGKKGSVARRKYDQLARQAVVQTTSTPTRAASTSSSQQPALKEEQPKHQIGSRTPQIALENAPLKKQSNYSTIQRPLDENEDQSSRARDKELEEARARIYSLEVLLKQQQSHREVGSSSSSRKPGGLGGDSSSPPSSHAQKVLGDQERLISGYQRENERLVAEMKDIKTRHDEERVALFAERQKLVAEVNRLQNQVGSSGVLRSTDLQARLNLESQVKSLAEELEVSKKLIAERESELRKQQQQQQIAAGESSRSTSSKALQERVRELEVRLQKEVELRKEDKASLQRRIDWYIENQEIIDGHVEEIKFLKGEAESLKEAAGKSCPQCKASARKLKSLRTRVAEMEREAGKRDPGSLVNLIRATQSRESEEEDRLKGEIEVLRGIVEDDRSRHDISLRTLRQEHERVVQELRKRAGLDSEYGDSPGGDGDKKRKKESAESLRIRALYEKKLQESERKYKSLLSRFPKGHVESLAVLSAEDDGDKSAATDGAEATAGDHEACKSTIALLESKLMRTSAALGEAQGKLHLMDASSSSEVTRHAASTPAEDFSLKQLQKELHAAEGRAQSAEAALDRAQKRVTELTVDNRLQSSPLSARCAALAAKLEIIEQRTEQRVEEVTRALRASRNQARIDAASVQAHHEHEMKAKVAEIDRLRSDLERLLSLVTSLRKARGSSVAANSTPASVPPQRAL